MNDQQQLPAIQVLYPMAMVRVEPGDGRSIALVFEVPGIPPHSLIFPMPIEAAQNIAKQLLAPRVVVPDGSVPRP